MPTWKDIKHWLHHPSPQWLMIAGAIVAIIITAGMIWYVLSWRPQHQPVVVAKPLQPNTVTKNISKKDTQPITEPSIVSRRLDGLLVARSDANTVPGCVMIENAAFGGVRPQSGLGAASLVYEIIVEGGITRLMAVYAGEQTATIGPVRSARDTYIEFASELQCAYAHAGGSYTALLALQNFQMRDLDGLREPTWFWRDPGKFAPHNLFTSSEKLYQAIIEGHSWTEPPTYDSWKFVEAVTASTTATEVNVYFGGAYDVRYTYQADKKYYERYNGGELQHDATTSEILSTRNIVIQQVPAGWYVEGKGRINFSVTGEGKAYVFREGTLTEGIWRKPDRLARTTFYNSAGNAIEFVRGNTWVEIVPVDRTFDWK
ncbi:MAG: DUF3048 domain-containing protein [Candidatus Kerfeldbacteria bacterium]|nr:DUF3048 domain-containing protein [Candidatus Kerfeldbacteria bacterium]